MIFRIEEQAVVPICYDFAKPADSRCNHEAGGGHRFEADNRCSFSPTIRQFT